MLHEISLPCLNFTTCDSRKFLKTTKKKVREKNIKKKKEEEIVQGEQPIKRVTKSSELGAEGMPL